jgi:site-specific recombinase XerD
MAGPRNKKRESFVERFCGFLATEGRTPITIKNYRIDIEGLIQFLELHNRRAFSRNDLTASTLSLYRESLVTRYKPATVNRKLYTLKIFLRWAGVSFAPVNRVPLLQNARLSTHEASRPVWLEPSEQKHLQNAVESGGVARDIALVTLMLNTGLRISEVITLRWRDVRISENEANLIVREAKKGRERAVPLNRSAQDALLSVGYTDNSGSNGLPIFPFPDRFVARRHIETLIKRYCQLGGIEKGTPRIVRHTFCRNLARSGVTPSALAKLTGHSNVETALRYYEDLPNLKATLVPRFINCSTLDSQIRELVLKSSNGTCARCGEGRKYPGFFQVHQPLRTCETKETSALNCVVLCPNCHIDIHLAPNRDEIEAQLVTLSMKYLNSINLSKSAGEKAVIKPTKNPVSR